MKRFTMNCMIAAAALTALAASAPAQTRLKADIPFAFRSGGAVLPAGSYVVIPAQMGGHNYFTLANTDNKRTVMSSYAYQNNAPKAWVVDGKARLTFECVETRCALKSAWTGAGTLQYQFHTPRHERGEMVRTAEIRLNSTKAD